MQEGKITIFKPINDHPVHKWRHAGDTFRELIDMWEKAGYVDVVETLDSPGVVWMCGEGDVLLYDRPTLEWYPESTAHNIGLFGNPPPPSSNSNNPTMTAKKNVPWIFWGRHPKLLEQQIPILYKTYDQRSTESIFIGNIENNIQLQHRSHYSRDEWRNTISHFELNNGHTHKYSQEEYLKLLADSKFGLSIRGYGPKCNREIELLGLGVVPLLTNKVDTTYYDPLIEGLHYFRTPTADIATHTMKTCSQKTWEMMSRAGKRWYNRNCSTQGSFKTTKRIIEKNRPINIVKQSTVFNCISTMATNNCWIDLQLMLFSLYQFHSKDQLTIYIACDDFIWDKLSNNWANIYVPDFKIICIKSLNKYSGQTRAQLEQKGEWLNFMLEKCTGIDMAFDNGFNNVLFVDSDMVFLNKINFEDFGTNIDKSIGRSRHYIKQTNQRNYGAYNGGMLWINHQGFTDWWRYGSYTSSRYYEQAILEDTDKYFSSFDIPIQYNYGWWRLYECEPEDIQQRESQFRVIDDIITYDGKPLRSIHTHFGEYSFIHTVKFNAFIYKLFKACTKNKQIGNIFNFIKSVTSADIHKKSNHVQKQFKDSSGLYNTNTTDRMDKSRDEMMDTPSSMNHENGNTKGVSNGKETGIHLIVQYYNDKDTLRQDEIDYCFKANLENPYVVKLHNLVERSTIVPDWLKSHPKYMEFRVDNWLTYKQVFDYTNDTLPVGSIACLCNADIFLDHSSNWLDTVQMLDMSIVFCLSRHEFNGVDSATKDVALQRIGYANAQDAWLYKTPMLVRDCNFKMGKLGSDNAIGDRIKNSGYIPINSPNQYKIYHYDVCRGKTGSNYLQHQTPNAEKPEDRGYYLLPDIDSVNSVDQLIKALGLGELHKYRVICDIMSKYIEIKNPDATNK